MTGDDQPIPPPDEDRTIFNPGAIPPPPSAPPQSAPPQSAPPVPPPATSPPMSSFPVSAPPPQENRGGRIQVGDVLNHIFEVRRFIARGGMGEVFEGINVNSEERVAIKGILGHLAADAAVQAMFRKEARTLTRLSHPALVQYRVLAQEPQLGVFYIVTEYIDGENLSNILSRIDAGPAELVMLTRRLAEGLAAAHTLGAIHRDISPDNIMLEEGRLDRAKIIDFGIAKDLDASTGTIVGDGFAGKLNYVAPEQLGDFDRSVGPWTDVYSLGLTMLAVARKKDVDMGATLVDAVDRRRAGPDLSPIPQELRPVFERMLRPNPAERPRSMEEVVRLLADPSLAALGPGNAVAVPPAGAAGGGGRRASDGGKPAASSAGAGRGKLPLIAGGGVALLLAIILGVWLMSGGKEKAAVPSVPAEQAGAPVAAADPVSAAREALAAGLVTIPCTWLDVSNVEAKGSTLALGFRGVAGKPAEAQGAIGRLLAAKGLQAGSIDFSDVSPIDARECAPLEAFRKIRASGEEHLSVPQRSFQMVKLGPEAGQDAGKMGAQAILNIDLNGEPGDVSLVGLEPSGTMTQFVASRKDITDSPGIDKPQPGVYRITLNTTHVGWSGILMLSGKGPFDASLLSGEAGSHGGDWPDRFLKLAQERGWKSEMVWYRTVDQPGG